MTVSTVPPSFSLRELDHFKGLSFPTISSTGPNAAIIHYQPSPTDSAVVDKDQVYLCDSGAQFLDGTTDVTRTWVGTPQKFPHQQLTARTAFWRPKTRGKAGFYPCPAGSYCDRYRGFSHWHDRFHAVRFLSLSRHQPNDSPLATRGLADHYGKMGSVSCFLVVTRYQTHGDLGSQPDYR